MSRNRAVPKQTAYDVKTTDAELRGVRLFLKNILESDEYRSNLKRRALAGVIHPKIEEMLWHYLYGKPRDIIDLNINEGVDYSSLSESELVGEVKRLELELVSVIADVEEKKRKEKARELAKQAVFVDANKAREDLVN